MILDILSLQIQLMSLQNLSFFDSAQSSQVKIFRKGDLLWKVFTMIISS